MGKNPYVRQKIVFPKDITKGIDPQLGGSLYGNQNETGKSNCSLIVLFVGSRPEVVSHILRNNDSQQAKIVSLNHVKKY